MLLDNRPLARDLSARAKGIVVCPDIVRENHVLGVQSGYGALLVGGKIAYGL